MLTVYISPYTWSSKYPTDERSVSLPIKTAQLVYSFNFLGDIARGEFYKILLLCFIGDLS